MAEALSQRSKRVRKQAVFVSIGHAKKPKKETAAAPETQAEEAAAALKKQAKKAATAAVAAAKRQAKKAAAKLMPLEEVADALKLSYVPAATRHRETESAAVLGFLRSRIEERCGGSLYVCGSPGTGKTLHVLRARDAVQEEHASDKLPQVRFAVLGCTPFGSPVAFARAVGEAVAPRLEEWSSLDTKTALDRLEAVVSKRQNITALILDEVDSLLVVDPSGEAIRRLFTMAAAPTSKLALVGIANSIDFPRKLALSEKPLTVVFSPYTPEMLVEILQERVGSGAFEPKALEMCARKVAAATGDARRALDVAAKAVRLAIREAPTAEAATAEASDSASAASSSRAVTIKLVKRAVLETLGDSLFTTLGAIPHHAHVMLSAALRLVRGECKTFTHHALVAAYAAACPGIGGSAGRHGAAKDALSILVEHGLVGDEKAPTTSLQRTPAHNPHAQHKRTLRFKVDIEDLNAVLRNSAKTAALDH